MLPSISCFLDSIRALSPLSTAVTPPARISSTRPSTSTRSAPSAAMPIALPATPTSVRTVRPVKVSRSRTSCLNRSSSKAGGGSTRERAADRNSPATLDRLTSRHPAHFHRRGSLLQPGIEVLDPLPKVEADPDNDRSGPGALAKDTPKLSALHLDVVGPLDPGLSDGQSRSRARAAANPTRIGTRVGGTSESLRTRNEIHRPIPRGESQRFPPRPFPAVWKSAVTTVKWEAPASARARRRSFVEGSSS